MYIIVLLVLLILLHIKPSLTNNLQTGGGNNEINIKQLIDNIPIKTLPDTIQKEKTQIYESGTLNESGFNNAYIMLSKPFIDNGLITEWVYDAEKQGTVIFMVLEQDTNGLFIIKGTNQLQITKPGKDVYLVSTKQQLPYNKGNFFGFYCIGKNILTSQSYTGEIILQSNSSKQLGINSTLDNITHINNISFNLSYNSIPIHVATNYLGSLNYPAKSAAHILAYYKNNNLGTPHDGVYWIQVSKRNKAQEIYCNFSLRSGYGYMLVASVEPNGGWAKISSVTGNIGVPFNPNFKYGEYDKYNRNGTYYLDWASLDRNALADGDPQMCKGSEVMWNTQGKYCGDKQGKRLDLENGVNEILLSTGNHKYWVVLDRKQLNDTLTQNVLTPIATSDNFRGDCEPNKSVTVVPKEKSNSPWINAGSSHACGDNYMMWGEDGSQENESFKNQNQGIKLYIGTKATKNHTNNGGYRYNPTFHKSSERSEASVGYLEAEAVCKSFGKVVCSKSQLDGAKQTGYGNSICGWTSTPQDKYSMITSNSINVDLWADGEDESCIPQNILNGRAGIYCCDSFEFIGFRYLDKPYNNAGNWIIKLEKEYKKINGISIPVDTELIVWSNKSCNIIHGLAVKKQAEYTYVPIDHPNGSAPMDGKIEIKPQLIKPDNNKAYATWLTSGLKHHKGSTFGSLIKVKNLLRYGMTFSLFNKKNETYLTISRNPYTHIKKEHSQVFGFNKQSDASVWQIVPRDASTSQQKDVLINNGDMVQFVNLKNGERLSINTGYSDSNNKGKLITTLPYDSKNNLWRINGDGSSNFIKLDIPIRLSHSSTGLSLELTGKHHLTKNNDGTSVMTVSGTRKFNNDGLWNIITPEIKRKKFKNKLQEIEKLVN